MKRLNGPSGPFFASPPPTRKPGKQGKQQKAKSSGLPAVAGMEGIPKPRFSACATCGNGLRRAPPRRLGLDAIALPRAPGQGPFSFTGVDGDANARLIT